MHGPEAYQWAEERQKRTVIASMTDKEEQARRDRQSIADVIAAFYKDLYNDYVCSGNWGSRSGKHDQQDAIPQFARDELETALRQLRSNRAADYSGISADVLN